MAGKKTAKKTGKKAGTKTAKMTAAKKTGRLTAGTKTGKLTMKEIRQQLEEVARIGQIFIDGDLCRKMWHPHAETFMCGDDMDYNPEAAVPVKKTLFRLERVCRFPCSVALWRRRPDLPKCGEPLMFGSFPSPGAGAKPPRDYVPPKMTPELKEVFLRGRNAVKVLRRPWLKHLAERWPSVAAKDIKTPALIHVFVPVRDSMGDIAAALEVFTIAT